MPKLTEDQADDLFAIWNDPENDEDDVVVWMEFTQEQYEHWVSTDEPPEMSQEAYDRAVAKLKQIE